MTTTTYKGYAIITTGTAAGTWGDTLNTDVFATIDTNMAGIVSKTPAGSNITLSASEAKCALISLSGTGPSANIQVISANQGFYFVENLCTGNFTITVTNGVAGVVVPKGQRVTIFADATNGCRIVGADGFASGTTMLFKQTAAPSGWTKDTSNNDKALRITNGTVSTGGTLAFSTCFNATRSLTGSTASYALQIADIPAHAHVDTKRQSTSGIGGGSGSKFLVDEASNQSQVPQPTPTTSTSVGGGGGHAHTAGTLNVQMDVSYVDVILAAKD